MTRAHVRGALVAAWLVVVTVALYLFFFERALLERELQSVTSASMVAGTLAYVIFGCIRGFTLIPVTALIVAALPFFPPVRLFVMTVIGILVSSASVYLFSEALHLDEVLARKHARRVGQLQGALQKYELPVIIGWSFFPFVPTDLICYVCGVLRVDLSKCLIGVGIGEGTICAIYIFLGDYALRMFELRL